MYPFPLLPRHRQLNDYLVSFSHPVKLVQSCRKWLRYESFLKENVRLTPKVYKDWEDIQRDLSFLGYECLITGGDQIWNMRCRDFDKSYYLPSKTPGIRKVSYAPSFGDSFLSTITPAQASFMKDCLSDYSFLSVREPSMQQYLSKLLGWEPTVTVDPTLLLQAGDYNRFIDDKPLVKGDYIFYYTPFFRIGMEQFAKRLGSFYGMKVVTSLPFFNNHRTMEIVPLSGPREFLNLVKNAKMVVGKSFHLVLFSLIFHKSFIAFGGAEDDRMNLFLEQMGIPERGNVNEGNYRTFSLPEIDFTYTDSVIATLRAQSESFLEEALR